MKSLRPLLLLAPLLPGTPARAELHVWEKVELTFHAQNHYVNPCTNHRSGGGIQGLRSPAQEPGFFSPSETHLTKGFTGWADALTESATLVFPVDRAPAATPDPGDEMVLECALAAEADYIVSGDKKHLLPLRQFREIPIVSPSDCLRRLATVK